MKPWSPPINAKQSLLLTETKTLVLLSGPRKSGKTRAGLSRLAAHAWTCPMGRISLCGRTQTDNYDGGAWTDLVENILQTWINADFGMEWITMPRMDGLTHKMFCEVKNMWGRPCRIQLDSIKIEDEVERIYRGKSFSMIYMTELSNFKQRKTFDIMLESLRMSGLPWEQVPTGNLPPEDHLLIGDTNPAEEGEDSWIYQLWWYFRMADDEALQEYLDPNSSEESRSIQLQGLKERQAQLSVHEYTIDDNTYLSDAQKREQFARYAHNQDLLDRFYYGKWKRAAGVSLFSDVFRPMIHVVGESVESRKSDPDIMLPEDGCSELKTGWDLGGANNAWHVVEKCFRTDIVDKRGRFVSKDTPPEFLIEKQISVFKVLDELVELGVNIPLEEIVEHVLDKIAFWESVVGTQLIWRHVSDRASFEQYDKIADTYEYKEIYKISDGVIELERGPVKKRGSVQQRVNLVRKLLFHNRIFVSSKCVRTIEMLNNLKKGRMMAIDPQSPYKHAFDSLTYVIAMECMDELERHVQQMAFATAKTSSLVVIPLG